MIPELIRSCPYAFESELLGPETTEFLVNVFMGDPDPWVTIKMKDPITGREVTLA